MDESTPNITESEKEASDSANLSLKKSNVSASDASSSGGTIFVAQNQKQADDSSLIRSLSLLDPVLQFLTKATGQTLVSLTNLQKTIPSLSQKVPWQHLESLLDFGILQVQAISLAVGDEASEAPAGEIDTCWKEELKQQWTQPQVNKKDCRISFQIGFPSGLDGNETSKKLSGSTKTAAKRRLAALQKHLKKKLNSKIKRSRNESVTKMNADDTGGTQSGDTPSAATTPSTSTKDWTLPVAEETSTGERQRQDTVKEGVPLSETEKEALQAFQGIFGMPLQTDPAQPSKQTDVSAPGTTLSSILGTQIPSIVLPKQLSFAGSAPGQSAEYEDDDSDDASSQQSSSLQNRLHPVLKRAFLVAEESTQRRRLYKHQAKAILSAIDDRHTLVCTGTGSGKSLCFWIPILQKAITCQQKSLVLFPTKALAQDQVVKLQGILDKNPSLSNEYNIRAATLDGDTPHAQRSLICSTCNIVLTNPDTLHASILPNWKSMYKELLRDVKYVVIDEAHMYEGVFGAHVAMILARLYRIHSCCVSDKMTSTDIADTPEEESQSRPRLVFLSCSATLAHPEHHFRLLCCIPSTEPVTVVVDDFSPRASKHFFVWNPPLLDENRKTLGYVAWPKKKKKATGGTNKAERTTTLPTNSQTITPMNRPVGLSSAFPEEQEKNRLIRKEIRRRHAADETALLLARAVTQGVRCIAFCKTRSLVEWVYERCITVLKQSPKTSVLLDKVDSYRGGYTKSKRRDIEEKLFNGELLGVVGTSALELGVDIGGVEVTLHCGFPSSHASLMQQAGRAGRGLMATNRPSLAVCVCFNSPVDQHLWRHPSSLLQRGLSAPLCMPIYSGLVQGHLLCAGNEFPLLGSLNVTSIQSIGVRPDPDLLSDHALFGSKHVYEEALENLITQGKVCCGKLPVFGGKKVPVYQTHGSVKHPWNEVSIRSIESVNYNIVDLSHPMQRNRTDGNHHEAAILDNIPYSRVFYHAFPGAIITHRGRRYRISSMARPPAFGVSCGRTMTLGAYAKPHTQRYFTRPLSSLKITVVKQIERVDILSSPSEKSRTDAPDPSAIFSDSVDVSAGSFAGCGVVTIKRNVHGYKKLSLVTREELSRSELALPDMEFDTFAFWLDCDASGLGRTMTAEDFGHGVHALSHALCNVAPVFVPCAMTDVQCDHSVYNPTRVIICDARAGGSGICAQLWKNVFKPKGLVQAALQLLESCPSCADDHGYVGGCPACIQAGECIKFNDFLCKSSAVKIGKHLLARMQKTQTYKLNEKECQEKSAGSSGPRDSDLSMPKSEKTKREHGTEVTSPRRKKRQRAMRVAKNIENARQRQTVVGRPSWPMDRADGPNHQEA